MRGRFCWECGRWKEHPDRSGSGTRGSEGRVLGRRGEEGGGWGRSWVHAGVLLVRAELGGGTNHCHG